ncbi:MAG: polysaccharide deacetylase family protein [Candidatus Koribacter versatilis]|uniref:Polysaccharide deacetylase family protein n=1 Tax=Candidatus Korobacter versatilis TaxID=658062 RepID=A0A932A8M8_9BACT|nr:polysaccharide deacetylase family protein [Candidatus Koribacter versatilis]
MPGSFVISLDFELHWGVRDHRSVADYRENLLGVRHAIPQMLAAFARFNVRATWATVGFLFFARKADLLAALPALRPEYEDATLSPYPELASIGDSEAADPFHYGASLLRLIQQTPGQEIATHTFSHYFCLEKGQTLDAFEADLAAAQLAAERFGLGTKPLQSLVFPRNQSNGAYLEACRRAGFVCYRGNQRSPLYAASDTLGDKGLVKRGLRLADAYLPLTGLSARSLPEIAAQDPGVPYDVPASRFLRPYAPRLGFLEPLRMRRIEREMTQAAERGLVYHLWWHPHNFGANTAENIAALERLLGHFGKLRREHGIESRTMAEVAGQAAVFSATSSSARQDSPPVNANA